MKPLIRGINCHFTIQSPYNAAIPINASLDRIQEMGYNWIRNDINVSSAGLIYGSQAAKWEELLTKAEARGMNILTMVGEETDYTTASTNASNEAEGYTLGRGWALNYGGLNCIKAVEPGNEDALFNKFVFDPGPPIIYHKYLAANGLNYPSDGRLASEFNFVNLEKTAYWKKGFFLGVKSVMPGDQSIVFPQTSGFLMTREMDEYMRVCSYDKVGQHTYSPHTGSALTGKNYQPYLTIAEIGYENYLGLRFNKKVWVTECNYQTTTGSDAALISQVKYRRDYYRRMLESEWVEACFDHELYDLNKVGEEGQWGAYRFTTRDSAGYAAPVAKPWANALIAAEDARLEAILVPVAPGIPDHILTISGFELTFKDLTGTVNVIAKDTPAGTIKSIILNKEDLHDLHNKLAGHLALNVIISPDLIFENVDIKLTFRPSSTTIFNVEVIKKAVAGYEKIIALDKVKSIELAKFISEAFLRGF